MFEYIDYVPVFICWILIAICMVGLTMEFFRPENNMLGVSRLLILIGALTFVSVAILAEVDKKHQRCSSELKEK